MGVLDEIVAKLQMFVGLHGNYKIEDHARPLPSRNKVQEKAEEFNPTKSKSCICHRPLKLVMCRLCGETFRGRVRVTCPSHPSAIFLSDVTVCRSCKEEDKLAEFELPAGMESGMRTLGLVQCNQ